MPHSPSRQNSSADTETLKLQTRIRRFATVGTLFTGLAVGLAAAAPFYLQLRSQTEMATTFHLQSQAQLIAQHFSRLSDVARQLTSRTQIRLRLEQYNRGEVTLENLVSFSTSRLQDAMVQSDEIAGLVRLDASGHAVISIGAVPPEALWPVLGEGATDPVMGKPHTIDGQLMLLVATPILDYEGKSVGTDIVSFSSQNLARILTDNAPFGSDANQYLQNRAQSILLKALPQTGNLTLQPMEHSPLVPTDSQRGMRLKNAGDVVLFSSPLPRHPDWQLLLSRDSRHLYQPVLQQILPPLVTILLMVLAGITVTSRVIRPLAARVISTTNNLADLNAQQQSLLELAHGFTFQQNASGVITHTSPGVLQVLGISAEEFPIHQSELLTDSPLNAELSKHQQLIIGRGTEPAPFTIEMCHRGGYPVILEISARPLEVKGKIIGLSAVARDVTHRTRNEERQRLAASVFQGSQEGIMILDTDFRIIEVNRAFSNITGFTRHEIDGLRLREFLIAEHTAEESCEVILSELHENGSWQGEVWYRSKGGELFPAWQNMSSLQNEQGETVQYIAIFTDISEKKAYEARIHHLAHHDLLTDLPNRVLLEDRLTTALARMRRAERKLAVLFLDLDRFKTINDSLGHPVGDKLLQAIARRLQDAVREQDIVARLGGDEFMVILEDLGEAEYAASVARKILELAHRSIRIGEHDLIVGASIGISIYPEDGDNPETLIKNADVAMYRAKETGRNTFQFYTPELTALSMERFELERDLRRALEQQELVLYYQPQMTVDGEHCIGVEALVRWEHPQRGLILPEKFIPLAEETGLILQLGRYVLETACEQAKRWQADGKQLRVAVNLSGHQIIFEDLFVTLESVLQQTAIDPRLLELEITEGFVINHAEEGIRSLDKLSALGIQLSIDDFGTGYSSLSYLKRLPVDRLKIDKSFVQGIPDDSNDTAIVSTIIAMADNLGMEVIAEGVESVEQAIFLARYGCNELQGFLFGSPMEAREFEQWYDNYHNRLVEPD